MYNNIYEKRGTDMKRLKKTAGVITDNIVKIINGLDEHDKLDVYNQCIEYNNYSEYMYPMDEFDELFGQETYQKVHDMMDANFSHADKYFYTTDTGELCSTNDIFEMIDVHEIADWIYDNHDISNLPDAFEELQSEIEDFDGYK